MSDSSVFDRTVGLMRDRLSLNSLNQRVISGNLANINTPGYAAKELSFEKALRDSLEEQVLHMVRSNGSHVSVDDPKSAMQAPELVETGPVDLDGEMLKLSRNSVEYQYIVSLLNKKFTMMKQAIGEGAQ
ncbi:MAG: flagellar basal body rod protein FlgB [Syntrophobacteraceae bacterium]|nr:flagellar basal body rod protein FlgB [Syntrophobacteraceae bacterium]